MFYRTEIRVDGGQENPDTSLSADFGKGDKGYVDNWPYFIIRITSSDTLLYKNDVYYNNYECRESTCEIVDNEVKEYPRTWWLPAFKASKIRPTLSLAGGAWSILGSVLWVQEEEEGDIRKNPNRPYGYIGLGFDGDSLSNFQTEYPIFSLYLNNETQRGEIIFGFDELKFDNRQPSITFPTDKNWISTTKGLKLGAELSKEMEAAFFFDLSYENIVLPELFREVVTSFKTKFEMIEDAETFYYEGDVTKLPSLTITFSNGTDFSIPPTIYMEKVKDREDYYAFKALVFGESIIFGQRVISNYYTLFKAIDMNNPTITIYSLWDPNYKPEPYKPEDHTRNYIVIIVVGVFLLVIFSALAFHLGRKSQVKRLDDYLKEHGDTKSFVV